jgi:hypothetical protein
LKVIQETRTAETRRAQRFLHILCALCASAVNISEPSHPKVEHYPLWHYSLIMRAILSFVSYFVLAGGMVNCPSLLLNCVT